MSFSLSEYTKIDVGWGLAPDPTRGAFSAPPDLPAGFKGADSRQEGNGGRYREGLGEEGKRGSEEKEVMGKGGEKGEVGGIAPWLLGDRRL